MSKPSLKAAHFLLEPVLTGSPPNLALKKALRSLGYAVDEYSELSVEHETVQPVAFGLKWLLKNAFKPHWRQYDLFTCTSEDPIFIVGVLSFIWRKPLVFLADEIRAGSYRGNRPEYFKRLCRWAMRRAALTIVNDEHRLSLQTEYAELTESSPLVVYPGCFETPPEPISKAKMWPEWNAENADFVLCFSGACNLSTGMDMALDALESFDRCFLVAHGLGIDDFNRFLIQRSRHADRIYLQQHRLSWFEAWASAAAADIGVAYYRNPAPQFRQMGISSNRLCMFLAMGVPVIVDKQPSFDFLHEFECGVQVETQEEFNQAIATLRSDPERFSDNALRCTRDYIRAPERYKALEATLRNVLTR